MAIVITNKTLVDGPKLALLQFTGFFTAATGEETDAVKVDASALADAPTLLKISKILLHQML